MGKKKQPPVVVLTGGGTGGHIYPAISIGRAIKEQYPEVSIAYFGTSKGLEAKLIKQENWPFYGVSAAGLRRKISFKTAKALVTTAKGYFEARGQLKKLKPNIVVGTGGYVCGPVVLAAAHLKIPTIIHEQNAYPGLTNRLLARVVVRVLVTFPQSKNHFPQNTQLLHTGLPIRDSIIKTGKEEGLKALELQDAFRVLVVGGSQGAKSINRSILEIYQIAKDNKEIHWFHIVGPKSYDSYLEELARAGIDLANYGNIRIMPYLFKMEDALSVADLVIGRAGASFLAEVMAKGLPSILIPYPYSAENHQEYNAKALKDAGASIVFNDDQISGEKLFRAVQSLYENPAKLQQMGKKAKELGKPEALQVIVKEITSVLDL